MTSGFSLAAKVCATTQEVVLSAVIAKLRTDIAEFQPDSRCFLCAFPAPEVELHENLFCTVAPADGHFEERTPVGSADQGIVEVAGILVAVWSRNLLDRLDHSDRSLTDASRGLLTFKHRILQSLAGSQLYSDPPVNSIPLLVEYLRPVTARHPGSQRVDDDFRSFSLLFQARFCWDLS